MCSANTIYNSATDQEIETPRQLRALVGSALCPLCADEEDEDACLCPLDVEGILVAAGIDYEGEEGLGFTIYRSSNDSPLE